MPIEDTVKHLVRRVLNSRFVHRAPLFLRTVIQVVGKFVLRFIDKRIAHRPRPYPIFVPTRRAGPHLRH
jgi:hypothetical protein